MSYSLTVAPDARAALASLDPWLAEETLDEIEKLLRDPQSIRLRPGSVTAVHDFVRTLGGTNHYLFLTIRPVPSEERLDVLKIGHVQR